MEYQKEEDSTITVGRVFGNNEKELLLSYLDRVEVDKKFDDALNDTSKHIFVFGSSKQGKTSLLRKHIEGKYNFIKIVCDSETDSPSSLYNTLLLEIGASIHSSTSVTRTESSDLSAGLKAEVKLKVFPATSANISGNMGTKDGHGETYTEKFEEMSINPGKVQDVKILLERCGYGQHIIILDNFHYLPKDVQTKMAFHLRTWNDFKIRFIVLGVWQDSNYLEVYNPDLMDRYVPIPVEPWTIEDFKAVAKKGAEKLNITFSDTVLDKIISSSEQSIGLFQELIQIIVKKRVSERKETNVLFDDDKVVPIAIGEKIKNYEHPFRNILKKIASSNVGTKENPYYLAYYIVKYIFSVSNKNQFDIGVTKDQIATYISENLEHRSGEKSVVKNVLGPQLNRIPKILEKESFSDLLKYSEDNDALRIPNKYFIFYLKNSNSAAELSKIPKPWEIIETEL